MNPRSLGYLFCALAMLGVGSTVVVSKTIAAGLPPFSATALRFAIAFPVFVVVMRVQRVRWPRLRGRDVWLVIAQAGAGSVGYTVFLISGMKFASAADAGVLACTVRFDALTGTRGATSLAGNLLVFAAVVCESLFILLNRKLSRPVDALPLSALMSGIGLAVAIVPACFEKPWTLPFDAGAFAGVVYYALVPTVAGFVLWYAGAARISGAEAGLMTAVVPVSAVVLAALVLHEPITGAQLAGVACVLGAVWLATLGSRSRTPNADAIR
ncbi:DMT family transporter [Paraburkholderia sp.]|uniref:DMT family transporter n=1 Tax=Paraburkholderia sp. TaxID=1926495 RepID=UPI003D6FC62E